MSDLLNRLRGKSVDERRIVALIISSIIVLIIFFIWATTFFNNFTKGPDDEVRITTAEEAQQASVIESVKRKASLLFGEGSPLSNIDFNFGKPIEYKQEEVQQEEKSKRDIQALLEQFNASSTQKSQATSSEQNDENSL